MAENRYGWDWETGRLRVNPRLLEGRLDDRPGMGAATPGLRPLRPTTIPELATSKLPTGASRDMARMALHGFARTGNMILKFLDIPNRVFGNTRSMLQDIYERSEANLERDAYEDRSGVPQVGETAVHLASAGILGKALPAVFGANVGADTYETAKYAGASEGEALAKGLGHGAVDTAIWTLGQGLASKYLPKAWQWLGRELTGATRGAASSVTSDAVLNSLGADISGEEMAKRAVHAAWMVPLLGMLKMGGRRREEAMSLLRKARPDLAGAKADKVIETIEAEFADPKSQKVALAWVARKGANLPDDTAQIRQALEVSSKVKGLDPMSRSPFEILSDPAYARYLPKPRPQDVKAFSNMKRYPMGVIGFDVSDDVAGCQATREMINAYMSPSSNPWCLATGKDAARLGELGPSAEGYWKGHSAVPKQIFFQEVDGKLELTAFRATSSGGEGQQEYWDTSDAGYSGIPIKVKVPGDPMGRYRKMVFRPDNQTTREQAAIRRDLAQTTYPENPTTEQLQEFLPFHIRGLPTERVAREFPMAFDEARQNYAEFRRGLLQAPERAPSAPGEVQGTFEDIAPGKVFKGDPFRDGRSQTWVKNEGQAFAQSSFEEALGPELASNFRSQGWARHDETSLRDFRGMVSSTGGTPEELSRIDRAIDLVRASSADSPYVLVEDKIRTTENGITKFRTTKYADPTDWDYEPPKPGEAPKPVEIEESELVSPEWMRSRGYDPESEADVRRMQSDLDIRAWGNGMEAAMAVVPTKRTYMQTRSGTPETVTYGPNGRAVVSVDFAKDGVPYRLEYFHSGPADADPSSVYHTIGYDGLPYPTMDIGINEPSGSRLTRNPDSVSPEVLNEVKWDEGLGGFVRTSGNRRWVQKGTGSSRIYAEDRLGLRRAMTLEEARQEMLDLEDDVVNHGGLESHRRLRELEEAIERHHAGSELATISVEDRQPDGTWAPVKTVKPLSPRREVDADEDDIPMWAQADMTDERIDEEMRELSLRENEGIRRMERERFLATEEGPPDEPVPAPQQPEDDGPDWDVQMAAKAGDADRFSTARNFLATDEVPETIFGIPVVAREEDYTPEDLAFFRKHPEAGGYYDMGNEEEQPSEEPVEERPVQAASKAGDTGGEPKTHPGKFKGWRRDMYQSYEDALKAEAAAVAFVNEGIIDAPPLTEDDLADSRKSAQWLKDHERKGLVKEGTLPHVGRPRFRSLHGFYDSDKRGFQGDRFSATVAVDRDAFEKDPATYEKTGQWAVIPTIYPDPDGRTRLHTRRDAEAEYRRTGGHFGIYEGVENGNLGGKWDHHKGNAEWAERETRQDSKGGKTKRKVPPIVKGPIHYGPPPPPERGAYPGSLNNPGNVEKHERRSDKTLFKGEIGDGVRPKRFANFSDPVDGLTAAATVLSRRAAGLAAKGLPFTIENYVPGYAPKSENDTEGYIRNLSKYSGFARDEELDPGNVDDMARLLKNVVRFESGVPHSEWFTDDEYRQAALAMQEGAVD